HPAAAGARARWAPHGTAGAALRGRAVAREPAARHPAHRGRAVQRPRDAARVRADRALGTLRPRALDEDGETTLPLFDRLSAPVVGRARRRSGLAVGFQFFTFLHFR